ncbi:peptidylprolyl isomerase [Capronia epimyces CBS 606.96]|uniref:peptidylprolyl isomerase n=1 Tax=Capronia epimyces CBS 606.96 TaxID=1182542 RepID=W9XK34_9EURO|nr:peptidylprolyl isomerase [Capronia epimyces CBS 606.96]EXJ80837.1 peptidylprolyl isomerase [Capronia epimyces CBS 606.96]
MSQFERKVITPGNGVDYPQTGDQVTIEYTGWLFDPSKAANGFKGTQFDSSVGRGDFQTQIGVGRVIPGWDVGVKQMSLGEKSTLIIPGNMAYGERLVLYNLSQKIIVDPTDAMSRHPPVTVLQSLFSAN